MARQPRPRIKQSAAKGKNPRQSGAGWTPTNWRIVEDAQKRQRTVTVEEALAAFANEPKASDQFQRIAIYGWHTPYRAGEVDANELDTLGASAPRGDFVAGLREIQNLRDLRHNAMIQDFYGRFGPNPPIQIESAHMRAIKQETARYEQELLREWANVAIPSAAPWKKVMAIWVAS